MRIAALIVLLACSIGAKAGGESPLAAYSTEWNKTKYKSCNTAAGVRYLPKTEKEIIYILNLARMYPALFCSTVVAHYPEQSHSLYYRGSAYYRSLMDTMPKLKRVHCLQPDSLCYVLAECHARVSGRSGYMGHEHAPECSNLKGYFAECCCYGTSSALDIVMCLLIDDKVPSLGHRVTCLGIYKKVGVSSQTHIKYGVNTVFEFR